jgi:hypothetical protein
MLMIIHNACVKKERGGNPATSPLWIAEERYLQTRNIANTGKPDMIQPTKILQTMVEGIRLNITASESGYTATIASSQGFRRQKIVQAVSSRKR